jgi:hypothetical protein
VPNVPEIPRGEIERIEIARKALECLTRATYEKYKEVIASAAVMGQPVRTYYCEERQSIIIEKVPAIEWFAPHDITGGHHGRT